jgi:hypothetical protein
VQNFCNTCFDVGFQAETRDFSPYARVETGCGAQPVSCPMGTGSLVHGVKAARREADHSPRHSAEVNKKVEYTSNTPYVFMARILNGPEYQGQLRLIVTFKVVM